MQGNWDKDEQVKCQQNEKDILCKSFTSPFLNGECFAQKFVLLGPVWKMYEKDCSDNKSRRCKKPKGVKAESMNQAQSLIMTQVPSWGLFQIDWSFCCRQQKRPTGYDRQFVFIYFPWSSLRSAQTHQQNVQELFNTTWRCQHIKISILTEGREMWLTFRTEGNCPSVLFNGQGFLQTLKGN